MVPNTLTGLNGIWYFSLIGERAEETILVIGISLLKQCTLLIFKLNGLQNLMLMDLPWLVSLEKKFFVHTKFSHRDPSTYAMHKDIQFFVQYVFITCSFVKFKRHQYMVLRELIWRHQHRNLFGWFVSQPCLYCFPFHQKKEKTSWDQPNEHISTIQLKISWSIEDNQIRTSKI